MLTYLQHYVNVYGMMQSVMSAKITAKYTEKAKHGAYGRSGEFSTRRGIVQTPLFMPVGTRGAVKSVTPELVAGTGAQIILGNTYHLHLRPGEDTIAALGGLHDFTRWPGPILTDSGGFQVFSLAHIRKITEEGVTFKDPVSGDMVTITPEISMQVQFKLGSDIIMAFDDLTGLDEHERSRIAGWTGRLLNSNG
jgi:queuine tRNA-ribosyltransferase